MNWAQLIPLIFQLITMILKNKFEKDALEKIRKEDLHAKLADAIKRHDTAGINDILSIL